MRLAALAVLGASLLAIVATIPVGFNPTDDGFVLAQSRRLLAGQVPHLGFFSPRPVGSPLLHTIDLLFPGPSVLVSRWLVAVEVVVTAALLLRLITRRKLRTWGAAEIGLLVVSVMANLHTFPLLAWHTIDGLLVSAAGFVLVDRGCRWRSRVWLMAGAVLLGFTPVIKQSFVAVPLLGVVWVLEYAWWHRHDPAHLGMVGRARWLAVSLSPIVVPTILYGSWLGAAGALDDARVQLAAASVPYPLAATWALEHHTALAVLVASGLLLSGVVGVARWTAPGSAQLLDVMASAFLVVLALGAAVAVVAGRLSLTGDWATAVWWLTLVGALLVSVRQGRVDMGAVVVVGLGWMAGLSWGYARPALVAGSMLSLLLWHGGRAGRRLLGRGRRWPDLAGRVLVVVLALALVAGSVLLRRHDVYRDVDAGQQRAGLGTVSSEAWGIRSGTATTAYLDEVRRCLDRYPSGRLAVLPDNAVVPLLFDRTPAFPVDWWYPMELPPGSRWVERAVEQLEERRDYLVLFQTAPAADLSVSHPPSGQDQAGVPWDYPDGVVDLVAARLSGRPVRCGPFVGRFAP